MADVRDQLQAALGSAFTIEREIVGGGMSRVFVATETSLGRRVAIKVLSPELANAMSAERFRREIQVVAQLQHPHIVPVHSAGDSGGLLFYTMPLVEGETLRERLRRDGRLPIAEAVALLIELADALAYAHGRGVVHRDIKPENVLLHGSHAMLADFGVSRALNAATGDSRLTTAGLVLGTPGVHGAGADRGRCRRRRPRRPLQPRPRGVRNARRGGARSTRRRRRRCSPRT